MTISLVVLGTLKVAVFSCSNYGRGYFNAYRNGMRKLPDIVLHLGDYIYEDSGKPGPKERNHQPPRLLYTLNDYRVRHAQYKTDQDLQNAHGQVPWFVVWDDHEFADNAWENGSLIHDPNIEPWQVRKAAAIQAYYEYMPIRQIDINDGYRIYRSFKYGKLFDLIMIDTRIYGREHQGEDTKNPNRTILGFKQEEWFYNELSTSSERESNWRIIANQVLFNQLSFAPSIIFDDAWEGYSANRRRVMDHIVNNNINDVVILTGDIHCSFAMDVSISPFDKNVYKSGEGSIAVEFVTTSVTSWFGTGSWNSIFHWFEPIFYKTMPQLKFIELSSRGYMLMEINKEYVKSEWWLSDPASILTINDQENLKYTAKVYKGTNRIASEENKKKSKFCLFC